MKKIMLIISAMLLFGACDKMEFQDLDFGQEPTDPPTSSVTLYYSVGGELKNGAADGGNINSGATITGDLSYYFGFWLEPSDVENPAKGTFTIRKESNDAIVYGPSAAPENAVDFLFSQAGNYKLNVTGTHDGEDFSFTNITIIVTTDDDDDDDPALTAPVKLRNFILSGQTASVEIAIAKTEYENYSDPATFTWFHVRRVSNQNFLGNQPVESTADSVKFNLSWDAVHNSFVEFNAGVYVEGSPWWLTPGYGQFPSILAGSENEPYPTSSSYFGFRLFIISPDYAELRTYDGVVVATWDEGGDPYQIPGNAGDGPSHQYTVRWSGLKHFIKTSKSTFRWKNGANGSWNYINMNTNENPNYQEAMLPNNTSGEIHFQWGSGTGSSFTPATSEMQNKSMFWSPQDGAMVRNI